MAVSAEFQEFVKEQLAGFGEVSVRRMFGGAGVFYDGLMFALIDGDDTLYLKTDSASAQAFVEEGCGPFLYTKKGKQVSLAYHRLPERLYDDPSEFCEWARLAHAVAVQSANPKRRDAGV